jgi:hypothetical protein
MIKAKPRFAIKFADQMKGSNEDFSFYERLNLLDFRDDLKYK